MKLSRLITVLTGGGVSVPFVGPLDGITSAMALSTRQLYSTYTGDCILLRRSSDDDEQAFGFTASGDLNTSAITAWLGADTAFVKTWYDQSGNGVNVSNATAADQPQLQLVAIGGKPSVITDTSSWLVSGNVTLFTGNQVICQTVENIIGTPYTYPAPILKLKVFEIRFTSTNRKQIIVGDGTTSSAHNSASSSYPNDTDFIGTYIADGTTKYFYNAGVLNTTISATGEDVSDISSPVVLFSTNLSGSDLNVLSELILFNGLLLDAQINAIGGNQGTYYGAGWTDFT